MGDHMSDFVMTIGGDTVPAAESFGVVNPANGEVFAHAPECSRQQLDAAFDAAAKAQRDWKSDEAVRRQTLLKMADVLLASAAELAPVLTAEQGKPLGDANIEVFAAAIWCQYFANLETPPQVIQDDDEARVEVVRRPVGVVAAITPWNFPLTLAFWKIAPALLAGNTLVLKPSPFTPLTTLKVVEILRDVMPPGVVNVVSGGDELGAWMTGHPVPRKVSFTGSIETGKKVAMSAAPDLKRVTLELGGNDPAIVLDDADPAVVSKAIFAGAFNNNGQVCSAIKRVYVPESLYDDVVDGLAAQAAAVKVGDGTEADSKLGPINNAPQFERVKELVGDALSHGATAAIGRPRHGPARLLLRADHPGRAVRRHPHRRRGAVRPGPAGDLLPRRRRRGRAGQRHPLRPVRLGVGHRHRPGRRRGRPARVRHGLGQHPPGPGPPAALRRVQVERGRASRTGPGAWPSSARSRSSTAPRAPTGSTSTPAGSSPELGRPWPV